MTGVAPAVASHLVDLRARLLRFPERREAAKRVDTLKQVLVLVANLRNESAKIRRTRAYVESVFPDIDAVGSARHLQTAQVKAKTLLRLLGATTAGRNEGVQEAVGDLRRAIQAAASAAQGEWLRQVEAVVTKYERLSQALQRTGVYGSAELLGAIGRVRAMSNPPTSQAEANRASEDIASVGPTLARLGLEGGLRGAVGGFLMAVADGRGNAKSLLDSEVREFLDRHDLWNVFTVSFR